MHTARNIVAGNDAHLASDEQTPVALSDRLSGCSRRTLPGLTISERNITAAAPGALSMAPSNDHWDAIDGATGWTRKLLERAQSA